MNCIRCKNEMKLIAVNDNPNRGYAYNVYHCVYCMVICHSNVNAWENKEDMWIYADHSIEINENS